MNIHKLSRGEKLKMAEKPKTISGIICLLLCLMCVGFMNRSSLIAIILLITIVLNNHGTISIGQNKLEFLTIVFFAITFVFFGFIGGVRTAFIGVLLPVGYCIGSSIKSKNIDSIILLMAFSMDAHIILNLLYEIIKYGSVFHSSAIHFDVWSGMQTSSTGVMINSTGFLGCIYYLIFKSNSQNRIMGIILLAINTIYDLIMGGRTFIIILIIGIISGFFIDTIYSSGIKSALRKTIMMISIIMFVIFLGYIILQKSSSVKSFFMDTYFYKRFFRENSYENIITTGRLQIRDVYLSNMWKYPFGGRKLWNVANQYAHELYLDIYDIGGIIPYLCIIFFVIQTIINLIKFTKLDSISNETRVLLVCFYISVNVHFFVEPVLSGAPILLVVYCIVAGYISQCTNQMKIYKENINIVKR